MIVAIVHPDESVTYLAGDPDAPDRGFQAADELEFSGAFEVRSYKLIRAASVSYHPPENLTETVVFTAHRTFASREAADAYAKSWSPPAPGCVIFQTTGPVEGEEYLYMTGAVIHPPEMEPRGASLTLRHTITGAPPKLVAEPPPAPTPPPLTARMTEATDAMWFEVAFQTSAALTGDATNGWTDAAGNRWKIQQTTDLVTWHDFQFSDCAGSPADLGGGVFEYWSRAAVPQLWFEVMVDLTATTDRYGKSITDISQNGLSLSLDYPYPMPADMEILQVDLRAAGYHGALVTYTTGPLLALGKNHTAVLGFGATYDPIVLAMSGSSVTSASVLGVPVSLPGAPYAMPGQRAALQAALRAAGYSGSVVSLHQGILSIRLPNVICSGRALNVTLDPGDPVPIWDEENTYLGESQANEFFGVFSNVRSTAGLPLLEAAKQFARLAITTPA